MSISARLGLPKGHGHLPGGLGVCPRDDAGSRGLSTKHLLPWLALQQGIHLGEKLWAPGQLKRKRVATGRVGNQTQVPPLSAQGTTVRVITAIDQDKGRPRGIGYTIVSGKAQASPGPSPPSTKSHCKSVVLCGAEERPVGVGDSDMRGPAPRDNSSRRTWEGD